MIWFTSDTHFNHRRVIEYCKRPYGSTEEMDAALIANWNKSIGRKHHVYVLGDFSFGGKDYTKNILSQLNGHKILVKGNHDKETKNMLDLGFSKVVENERIKLGDTHVLLSHFPYHPVTQHNTVGSKVLIHKMDKNVDGRYLHKRILDDGETWLLHGHVHCAWKVKERMINVGVDVWNYKPISHEKVLDIIRGGKRD